MSFSIPTWLKQDDDLMLGDRPGSSDWFALSDEVGRGRTNHRRDVIKVESLLNQAGLFDLEKLDGPWGYANERLDAPIKAYQKRNGLKVDGFMRPDGETINHFRQDFGDVFAEYPAPTPAMADAHHALREKGEDGLLVDRWPELKINPHPRLDPLTAGTGLDEWNDSWVRHAIRANGSFEGIPAELRKNIDVDAVRGMIQARDMTRRWEAQRPGEGNQFARAMLHALGDKPDYQSAYLASEIPQGPPIGTLRPDAAQRYAAMVEEGRATTGGESPMVIPGSPDDRGEFAPKPESEAPLPRWRRDPTELSDEDIELDMPPTQANIDAATEALKESNEKLKQASAAREAKQAEVQALYGDAFVEEALKGATQAALEKALKNARSRIPTSRKGILMYLFRRGTEEGLKGEVAAQYKNAEELKSLRDDEEAAVKVQEANIDNLRKHTSRRDALHNEITRRRESRRKPRDTPE